MTDRADDVDFTDPAMRARILDAVDRVCTRKQVAAVRLHLEGQSIGEIARAMGIAKSTAHRHLYGDDRPGHGGGALVKLRAELAGDIITKETDDVEASQREKNAAWFANIPPSRAHLFGPLAVLLVIDSVVDSRRSMRVADLALYMPKQVANEGVSRLRALGYIATDGVALTIRKTPLDEMAATENPR